jgi:hypothetical protein
MFDGSMGAKSWSPTNAAFGAQGRIMVLPGTLRFSTLTVRIREFVLL